MQALQEALRTLFNDPIAMGLLIVSLAAIIGHYGMQWQDKIEKQKGSTGS